MLALLGGALVVGHTRGDSATIDEPVHITSAVEIVRDGTGRWNPEHPPLAKALAGLALIGLPLSPVPDPLRSAAHGGMLYRFLFQNQTPGDEILFRSRLPFMALFVALVMAVAAEARRRFGPFAALAAASFTAFEPNLIGHAGVVHTDLAVTLALVLSLGPLRRLLDGDDRFAAPQLGLCWGVAFLCKYDAPLLALITLPLLFVEARSQVFRARSLGRLAAAAAIALVLTLGGFAVANRNQTPEDREALAHDRLLLKGLSPLAENAAVALGRVLPAAGNLATGTLSIALQSRVGAGVNYFLGRVSPSGSPFYFPVSILTKISLSLLAAVLTSLFAGGSRRFAAALGGGLLFFLLVSAGSTYNIGVRHVLFVFPFAALIVASAMHDLESSGRWKTAPMLLIGLLGVGQLCETLFAHPHELAFFNVAAGGSEGGHRFFVDSNLDWGQDLDRLARVAPHYSPATIPTIVFGGDLPARHFPLLGPVSPGDEDREGAILAVGEAPLALGPELLSSKGARQDAARLERL
ncbi:MAG: glycosyltransferase family 39 protein, partial [Thermoanaerobaculia bacterium]